MLYMVQVGLSIWALKRYRLHRVFMCGISASMTIDGVCSFVVIANEYYVSLFRPIRNLTLNRSTPPVLSDTFWSALRVFQWCKISTRNAIIGGYVSNQPWMAPATILLTYLSAALEQGFLTYRYWTMYAISFTQWCTIRRTLSRSRDIRVTSVIILLIVAHVGTIPHCETPSL